MKRIPAAVLLLGLLLVLVPAACAYNITFTHAPTEAKIGDVISLEGKNEGLNTIAVYFFVTGPGLDPRGASLDNIRVPTGGGLFTTAPVKIVDGTWQYSWDTSMFRDFMQPGYYTVYAIAAPIDNLRLKTSGEPFAETSILFLPPVTTTETESPVSPLLPLAALGIAAVCFLAIARKRI